MLDNLCAVLHLIFKDCEGHMIKVYGVPGWGSTISELMLTLADIPYQFVDVSGFDHEGTSRDLLKTLNPLCQVPTLAL